MAGEAEEEAHMEEAHVEQVPPPPEENEACEEAPEE
jgi:hypothetical protein